MKPSAPVSETVSKTGATNVQSSAWKPSGGYGSHQTNNQPYNPSANSGHGGVYNPSTGGQNAHAPFGSQSYNPSHSQPYNPSHSQTYNPSHNQPFNPSHNQPYGNPGYGSNPSFGGGYHPSPQAPYNGYNPSFGHSYTPGAGYNPPVGHAPQTILVQSAGQPYKPGIGQIAKEALVFAGVSAGVNAVANRIIPGGIYGTSGHHGGGSSAAAAPATTHTQITYNNYYNNGTAPQPAPDRKSVV